MIQVNWIEWKDEWEYGSLVHLVECVEGYLYGWIFFYPFIFCQDEWIEELTDYIRVEKLESQNKVVKFQ